MRIPASNGSAAETIVLALLLYMPAATARANPTSSAPASLVPVDGERYEARLLGLQVPGTIHVRAAAGERWLAMDDLVRWGELAALGAGIRVVTATGDLLVARQAEYRSDVLRVSTAWSDGLAVPGATVAAVVFQPPVGDHDDELLLRQLQDETTADRGGLDRLLLRNGDLIRGNVESIDGSWVRIVRGEQTDEHRADVPLEGVVAWQRSRIGQRELRPAGERMMVGLQGGTFFAAEQLRIDANGLFAVLTGGLEVHSDRPKGVCFLQSLGRRVTYLSDLNPSAFETDAYLSIAWPWMRDANTLASRLRVAGRRYAKGLGMHSASRLTYDLRGGGYRRFDAEAGVDDGAWERGSVVFRVLLYRGGRWDEAFRSGTVRGGQRPVPVSMELSGAESLQLVVEWADRGDVLDHADWLDARLIRSSAGAAAGVVDNGVDVLGR